MSSAAKGAAGQKAGGSTAARADRAAKKSGKRTIEFAGVTLSIPATEPPTFRWDFDEIASIEGDGEYVGGRLRHLAESVVGAEGLAEIREAIASGKAGEDTTILALVGRILREYGSDEGE